MIYLCKVEPIKHAKSTSVSYIDLNKHESCYAECKIIKKWTDLFFHMICMVWYANALAGSTCLSMECTYGLQEGSSLQVEEVPLPFRRKPYDFSGFNLYLVGGCKKWHVIKIYGPYHCREVSHRWSTSCQLNRRH